MDVTWQIKKNRQNNEKNFIVKNLLDVQFDSIAAMQPIIEHAHCFGVPDNEHLAV
jgi:hypothetical protein